MIDFQVTPIRDLDVSKPDYSKTLDQGLSQLLKFRAELRDEQVRTYGNKRDVVDFLKGRGVRIDNHEVAHESSHRDEIGFGNSLVIKFTPVVTTIAEQRALEDALGDYDRIHRDRIETLERNERDMLRAIDDYCSAALSMTKIEPLTTPNPDYRTVHFFIVRPDGVYEAHMDAEKVTAMLHRTELKPSLFDDGHYIEQFRSQSEGVEANAYLIRNPLQNVPVNALLGYAISQTFSELDKEASLREREADVQKSIGERLVDRIRKAMRDFRKK